MWRDLAGYGLWEAPELLIVVGILWLGVRRAWLPEKWALVLFLALVAKELLLYRLLRRTFRPSRMGAAALPGVTGVAEVPLAPRGQVRIQGELWEAEATSPEATIPAGTAVRVVAVQGLMLHVEAEERLSAAADPDRRPAA